MADRVAEIEHAARHRFVRWDKALFERVVEGPARALAGSLAGAATPETEASALLESYLRLASEAIGHGYLFPPEIGDGFLVEAFFRLIPDGLAAVPPARRAQALADCWNLGENLEHAPAWWRRIFLRLLDGGAALDGLKGLVERAAVDALGEPQRKLEGATRHLLLDLGTADPRFLPGTLHFVAPTVLCVHDRLDAATDRPRSVGAWLIEPPLVLGPMGCGEVVGASSDRLDLVDDVVRRDPRVADVLNAAANTWRAALTLETSQMIVAVWPP